VSSLRALCEALRAPGYTSCRGANEGAFYVDTELNHLASIEVLGIHGGRPLERFTLADLGHEIRVSYAGEDADSMRGTLDSLDLPDHLSDELGEQVFYMFRYHLSDIESGPVVVEQVLNAEARDSLHEFESILKRLVGVYRDARGSSVILDGHQT